LLFWGVTPLDGRGAYSGYILYPQPGLVNQVAERNPPEVRFMSAQDWYTMNVKAGVLK